MAVYGIDYESLAEGVSIPVGGGSFWDSFGTLGATATAKAAAATAGSRGCEIAKPSGLTSSGYLRKNFAGLAEFSWSIEFYLPPPPTTSQIRLLSFQDASGTQLFRLDQNSDNRLLVRNAASSTISSPQMGMASAGTVGDKMRWRGYWKKGTTTSNGTLRSELTNLTTSTLITDQQSTTLNVGTTDFAILLNGWPINNTDTNAISWRHDNFVYEDAPPSVGHLVTATPPAVAEAGPNWTGVSAGDVVTSTGFPAGGTWTRTAGPSVSFTTSGDSFSMTAPPVMEESTIEMTYTAGASADSLLITVLPHDLWEWNGTALVGVLLEEKD